MNEIHVTHERGDRFRIRIREHDLWVDQPVDDGGEDSAPTPTELFVAGLASCVAFYGGRFLRRHGIPEAGFRVECAFEFATDRPARVATVDLHVVAPDGFPDAKRDAFMAVMEHCTVHNSLRQPPEVAISLVTV
jgi:putative redox protein